MILRQFWRGSTLTTWPSRVHLVARAFGFFHRIGVDQHVGGEPYREPMHLPSNQSPMASRPYQRIQRTRTTRIVSDRTRTASQVEKVAGKVQKKIGKVKKSSDDSWANLPRARRRGGGPRSTRRRSGPTLVWRGQ